MALPLVLGYNRRDFYFTIDIKKFLSTGSVLDAMLDPGDNIVVNMSWLSPSEWP